MVPLVITVLYLLLTIINLILISHPMWFVVSDLVTVVAIGGIVSESEESVILPENY